MTFYLFQIYNSELENEFGNFEDWLCIFPLHRGKANEDEDGNEDEHFVGKYKVLYHLNDICAARGRKSLGQPVFQSMPTPAKPWRVNVCAR